MMQEVIVIAEIHDMIHLITYLPPGRPIALIAAGDRPSVLVSPARDIVKVEVLTVTR
jgi:hypothetical protein